MKISNQQLVVNQANKTAKLQAFDGGAREFLKSVAADLVNTNGSVKSGYLRLNAGKTEVSINHGHVGSGATAATRLMLNLVNEAYGEQASQALKNYLTSTSGKDGAVGKIGTQSFVALIKKMEEGASDNSDGDKNSVNNKIASAEVRNHRLNTTGLVATDERLQILNKTDLFSGVTQDSIKQAAQGLIQNFKPAQDPKATESVTSQAHNSAPALLEPKMPPTDPVSVNDAAPPMNEMPDADAPDLVVPPQSMNATATLSKSDRFSIDFDIPPFTPKQFTLIDSGPLHELGEAINQQLKDSGLQAPRGISKINVNGEPVYCYFDSTGKARAILPKGQSEGNNIVHVKTIDISKSTIASDYPQKFFADNEEFSGKDTKIPELDKLQKRFVGGGLSNAIMQSVGAKNIREKPVIEGLRDFLKPLANGERLAVQFLAGNDAWVGELSSIPGTDLSQVRPFNVSSFLTIKLAPLDGPLNKETLTTAQLEDLAPLGMWSKNARVQVNEQNSKLNTTIDRRYTKETRYDRLEVDYFEFLLSQETHTPGIVNRILVGAPTPDLQKTITSPMPTQILNKTPVQEERLEEFQSAAITAVNDIFAVVNAGFDMPIRDRIFMDSNAEKMEIKMNVRLPDRISSLKDKQYIYNNLTKYLITSATNALRIGIKNNDNNELTEKRRALVDAIQEHADTMAAQIN